MTTVIDMPRTTARARQLVAASVRASFDPFTDIDWDVALEDDAFYLPPEFLPLFGTSAWDAMTAEERFAYSRHEGAALCAAGIWFENLLCQALMVHLAEVPVTDPAHRYLLIEVADECRHSMMFGEVIRRCRTPEYKPALAAGAAAGGLLGNLAEGSTARAITYTLVLAVEEMLDVCNRATMKDERCHPLARQVARIHVLEEARHVSFARTYLAELWPTLPAEEQAKVGTFAHVAVAAVAGLVCNPDVYRTLGIEDGYEMARANPRHQERVRRDLARLTEFLTELGMIHDGNRPQWLALGLI